MKAHSKRRGDSLRPRAEEGQRRKRSREIMVKSCEFGRLALRLTEDLKKEVRQEQARVLDDTGDDGQTKLQQDKIQEENS